MSIEGPPKDAGITRNDVVMAYRLLLGREPENAAVVAAQQERLRSWQELRRNFMDSSEFRARLIELLPPARRRLAWPKMPVETEINSDELERMIAHVDANWEALGRAQPHWSVFTVDKYRSDQIDQNIDEFYNSGKQPLLHFQRAAERSGIDLAALSDCFELGCGVGRISVWLSELFPRVIAADISEPHMAHAREAASRLGRSNIEFRKLSSVSEIDEIPKFDVFFSVIVLQHNPPPLIVHLLRRFLGRLRPGGIAYFQVPTYRHEYEFSVEPYIEKMNVSGTFEMHCVPQPVLFRLFGECDCNLLEVREDDWAGSELYVSNSFLIQKRV